jgi:hypothetical protein
MMIVRRPRRLCPECHTPAPDATGLGAAEQTWVCGEDACSVREFTRSRVRTRKLPRGVMHRDSRSEMPSPVEMMSDGAMD